MKKRLQRDVDKVEAALIRFHRIPVEAEPGAHWQEQVMALIREESPPSAAAREDGRKLGGLIWRFAFATSLVALLAVAYAVHWSSRAQYELAELNLTDSAALEIVNSFGVR